MPQPFELEVPADERYRVLAPEVAGKYVEVLGGSAADAQGLSDALVAAMRKVANNGHGDVVRLQFELKTGGVHVTVRCGDQSAVVEHRIKKD
jgi:hypothetical protein